MRLVPGKSRTSRNLGKLEKDIAQVTRRVVTWMIVPQEQPFHVDSASEGVSDVG